MEIANFYYVNIYSTNGMINFVFNTLLQAKQFLSHCNTTVDETFRIMIFKVTKSIDNSGNITSTQEQVISW